MEDIGSRLGSSIEDRVRGARTRKSVRKSLWEDEAKSLAEQEYRKGKRAGEWKATLILGPLFFLLGAAVMTVINANWPV